MPNLGNKHTCYSCHTKFYDLGKPAPICPKCGADQRESGNTPVATYSRSRRVVEPPPVEEEEFESEAAEPIEAEDEEFLEPGAAEEEEEEEEEEEF
jgi:uncharacterized protein (TIGR02300 family)